MGRQMVTSDIRNNFTRFLSKFQKFPEPFNKTQVKLFPNFSSISFHYLLISWATNYAHNGESDLFIVSRNVALKIW